MSAGSMDMMRGGAVCAGRADKPGEGSSLRIRLRDMANGITRFCARNVYSPTTRRDDKIAIAS